MLEDIALKMWNNGKGAYETSRSTGMTWPDNLVIVEKVLCSKISVVLKKSG